MPNGGREANNPHQYIPSAFVLTLLLLLTGILEPAFLLLENCSVNTIFHLISVECAYSIHTTSTVTGFQVIARAPDYSQTHKLYSSKAVSPQRQVAIPVQEDGLYQVTVLGIRRGSLQLSNVEYEEMLMVNDSMVTLAGICTMLQSLADRQEVPYKTPFALVLPSACMYCIKWYIVSLAGRLAIDDLLH